MAAKTTKTTKKTVKKAEKPTKKEESPSKTSSVSAFTFLFRDNCFCKKYDDLFKFDYFFLYILATYFDYFKYRSNLFIKDKYSSGALSFKYYFYSFNNCIYNNL